MEKYDIHLLALAHVYSVPQLKQRCIKGLSRRLTVENLVDVLQLSRLCNAPDLYLRCMKLVYNNFKFIDEAESRKKRTRRHREEQRLYGQLSEAMSCLEHICTDGCTSVGPPDMDSAKKREPCAQFATCHGLQLLIRHFAACQKRVKGGCSKCKRMWQLLRLHSFICDQPEACKVLLCRQFKLKAQQEKRKDDSIWKLLARKVVKAKAMSSLSQTQAKRKRSTEEHRQLPTETNSIRQIQGFKLGRDTY
ncbi:hypothetical protein CRG98_012978 [Punica granatum]|nr:hypothetical protein CRG98_012978 [Punica granatum]